MRNKKLTIGLAILGILMLISCKKENVEDDVIKDIDGNTYHYINIGSQIWLKENLKTTTLNDGTGIPLILDDTEWSEMSTMAYSWYDKNESGYKNPYGALYNWHTVNTGKLCPQGWHVPSHDEWTELVDFLGGYEVAGGKMKEVGFEHWNDPNRGATNESEFTGLGHGQRNPDGSFGYILEYGEYWSSTEVTSTTARNPALYYNNELLLNYTSGTSKDKKCGLAVRCVKD